MGEPAPAGRVVDQAVLAERRARRAELAEQAAARRAEDAERRLIATRAELAELEARVQWLTADREAAEGRLAEQQRALRQSAQRLHAEQRRREELVEEVADRADQAEAEARELRTRLDEVERSAARMDAQLEELRRRTAESENALAAALAARRRSEREAADAIERLQALQAPREEECREQARWLAEAEQGLGLAHETIIQARLRLDELERTCDELHREATAERAVRHSLQAEMAEAREVTTAAEREAAELRRELAERVTLQDGAREVIDDLEHRLAALAAEVAGRDARAEEDRQRLGEVTAAAHDALEVAERRIGESLRAAGEVQRQLEHERALRQAVEEELAKAVEARAAAEREAQRRSEEHVRAQRTVHELRAELRRLRSRAPSATARDRPPTPDASRPWLARALPLMLRDDPESAARLLLALLPGQGLNARGRMDYDLDLAGARLHAVSSDPGAAAVVEELVKPRPDREVDFRLELDAAGLLALITGRRSRTRRGPRVRVRATRRRRRALRTFPAVTWSLGELARAGVWVDPCLAYRALTYLIEPGWTRGHSFCIAHEVTGPSPRPWYVHVRDGTLPEVTGTPPPEGPTATVRLTQAAFQARLDDEPPTPDGEHKPAIRGDVRSFSALAQWTEWARGIGAPPTD